MVSSWGFLNRYNTSVKNYRSIVAKDKTIIIAAHRLSTVQNADKIVFVKHGEISEMGTHNELISLKGDYWKLVKNQLQLSV